MGAGTIGQAVVVGGSVAGLAAACALSRRAVKVVLVERRTLPDEAPPVSVAAQGSFPHLLLAGGAAALERLAPGLLDDLFAQGAVGGSATAEGGARGYWWAEGQVRTWFPYLGTPVPLATRALIESRLRARVRRLANVTVMDAATVRGTIVRDGRVRGLQVVQDGRRIRLDADLVVDASGRSAAAAAWLREAGFPIPRTTRVEVGVTYTALQIRRRPTDLAGGVFAAVQNTREVARIGVAIPAEGDRWQIVLGGYFGAAAAATRDGVMTFAASLPDPVIANLLENDWLTEPAQFRFPASRRQHWDQVREMPSGLTVVGDAVASFNPLYGQGMSSATLQAEALGLCIDRYGNSDRLPPAVARATARVIANPWQIATGADFIYPQTSGPKPAGTDQINRYLAKLLAVVAVDPPVALAFYRVQHMLAAPAGLLHPRLVQRVLRAHRRLTRSTGPLAVTPAA